MPDPAVTPAAKAKESSFIVIHLNTFGHHFATRMRGLSPEGAAAAVTNHHSDNRYVHVYPDKGEAEVEYDGQTLAVTALSDEP